MSILQPVEPDKIYHGWEREGITYRYYPDETDDRFRYAVRFEERSGVLFFYADTTTQTATTIVRIDTLPPMSFEELKAWAVATWRMS